MAAIRNEDEPNSAHHTHAATASLLVAAMQLIPGTVVICSFILRFSVKEFSSYWPLTLLSYVLVPKIFLSIVL